MNQNAGVRKTIMLGAVIALFLCGCSSSKHLSEDFGQSYTTTFSIQVINPDAPEDKTPVDGYPGEIAEKVYEDYKSFEERLEIR